jgi:threonine/homoserine/homoserine lactone efflux protein
MDLLTRGVVIGFVIAAGLGPIGLLCIRRSLESGFGLGFATGLGAATADAIYAAVAAFGATALSTALVDVRRPLAVVGGLVLIGLGINAWLRAADPVAAVPDRLRRRDVATAWATTVGLTLTNPMTILSFAAAFVALVPPDQDPRAAARIVAGVGLGSAAWWLLLAGGTSIVRRAVTPRVMRGLRYASAVLFTGFGLVALGSALLG